MRTLRRNSQPRTWRMIALTAFLAAVSMVFVQITVDSVARAAAKKESPSQADTLPGQIKDDPTIAPDSEESADNNVTFPVDI